MNLIQRLRLPLATALLAAACGSVSAVNYIQIDGAHATFFYDADIFTPDSVSVVGDSIKFSFAPDEVAASVKVAAATDVKTATTSFRTDSAVLAVAHSGYGLSGAVDANITGKMKQTTGEVDGYLGISGYVTSGTYAGGAFSKDALTGMYYSKGVYKDDWKVAGTKSYDESTSSCCRYDIYQALNVSTGFYLTAGQTGIGSATSYLTSLTYSFNALPGGTVIDPPVPSVPEPGTYAMLLAGLAVMGVLARRRSV